MQKEAFQTDILRETSGQNWLIFSFIVLALAFVIIRLVYHRYWRRYRQALFFNLEATKLLQEKNVLLMQAAVSMNTLAVISLGLFSFLLIKKMELYPPFPDRFLGWMLGVLLVILSIGGRYMLIKILGRTGDNIGASIQINHQWLISLKNIGFFILPISAIAAFANPPLEYVMLFAGLGVIVFMLIFNYFKAFLILIQHRISIFYGILYLCTLEILPVLIIWKLIRLTL